MFEDLVSNLNMSIVLSFGKRTGYLRYHDSPTDPLVVYIILKSQSCVDMHFGKNVFASFASQF